MDEHTLRDFRELLESRMRKLQNDGSPYSRLENHSAIDPMDLADMASHHCDQTLVHTFQYRNQQLAREIRSAIQRIDEGEFGYLQPVLVFDRIRSAAGATHRHALHPLPGNPGKRQAQVPRRSAPLGRGVEALLKLLERRVAPAT